MAMEKEVQLRFRSVGKDAIGYLVDIDAPDDGGLVVRERDRFHFAIDALNGSKRERRIWITDTEEHARSLALMIRAEGEDQMMITRIADDIHALAVTKECHDNFNDGIPLISDLRHKPSVELVGDFEITERMEIDVFEVRPEADYQNLDLHEIDTSPAPDL